jgi:AcrR family transcriptional regulator
MAETVKRRYDSPRRREQAAATRRAILQAAERLFAERGYVGTSVGDVAAAAGVALKTVYAVFGTKAELLRALWNLRIHGDDDPLPLSERPAYRAVLDEPDPARRLELVAHHARNVRARTGMLPEIVRLAAPADEQIAALWARFEHELYDVGMRKVAESLDREGMLAVDVDTATDILGTMIHPAPYLLLVERRGWSLDRYERWLAAGLQAQLLP